MLNKITALLLVMGWVFQAQAAWIVSETVKKDGKKTVLGVRKSLSDEIHEGGKILREIPEFLSEDGVSSEAIYRETLFSDGDLPAQYLGLSEIDQLKGRSIPGSEVRTLYDSGPSSNRVDIVFAGDGYTMVEKELFFEDATRLMSESFFSPAFFQYVHLLNIHAVFVPSNESGITDTETVDTAFGLYRTPPGSKRGIFVGDPSAADAALALAPEVDYPILIANDNYYGGLGGRFAITTRSEQNGSKVLRHELGHNISNVGEEYDDGWAYFGANFSTTRDLSWSHWLTHETARFYPVEHLLGEYPWHDLSSGSLTKTFTVPNDIGGMAATVVIKSGGVGWVDPTTVSFTVDGNPASVQGEFTMDRNFYTIDPGASLSPGTHTITADSAGAAALLSDIRVIAHNSDLDKNAVDGFANFNAVGSMVGYRPTFDSCLMRDMDSDTFCHVDQESIWLNLLSRVKLVSGVTVARNKIGVKIEALGPELDLRYEWIQVIHGAEFVITGQESRSIQLPSPSGKQNYIVRASFESDSIRQVSEHLKGEWRFSIGE